MDKILKKMEEEEEEARSSFESFKTEILQLDSENKRRIDLLNKQLGISERKTRDMEAVIKSLEQKFKVQHQTVQYVQSKVEICESRFVNDRLVSVSDDECPRSHFAFFCTPPLYTFFLISLFT